MDITPRRALIKQTLESRSWKYMRLSAILLVPLVWFHTIINLDLVARRWSNIGWQVFDILLLTFAFSHGVNGLRQVLFDFGPRPLLRKVLGIGLVLFWLVLSIVGAYGIIRGVPE
jgi:succinate dehydrogenase / fumarate reductase, membrane anchor subunit